MARQTSAASPALPAPVRQLQRGLGRVRSERALDAVADRMADVSGGTARGGMGTALRGRWLGHALHPLMTDLTAGPWMAASFLDLFGPPGSERAARRLVGLGLLASVPTWLSGFADWQDSRGPARRVGLLHAATSSLATVLYAASYLARRRGDRRRGIGLGLAAGIVAFGDGYVGGELSLVAKVGTGRRSMDAEPGDRPEGADVEPVTHLRELRSLEELDPYVADDVFLRFSRGPDSDRDRMSRDYESGLELPGLSVTPLAPEAWWDRPTEDWLARQICKYVHLRTESDDDRYGWLLRGRVVSRGPDNEPLVDEVEPLARLSEELLARARDRYEERFDVGNDST